MTWTRDGSGLDVKRVRGMTLPQADARSPGQVRPYMRLSRKRLKGRRCDTSWFKDHTLRPARDERRDRRAKRLAKAAARRLDTLPRLRWRRGERVLAIPPKVLHAYLKSGRHERMREADHTLGS